MPSYIFEIQNSISIVVESTDMETARKELIDFISIIANAMTADCNISEGKKYG